MTTTAEPTIEVGFVPRSSDDWMRVPVGTELRRSGIGGYSIREYAGEPYLFNGDTPDTARHRVRTDGIFEVVSLPPAQTPPPQVGTKITTREQWEALPLGTVLNHRRSEGARWSIRMHGDTKTLFRNEVAHAALDVARTDGVLEVAELPGAGFEVGTRFTSTQQYLDCPVGTIWQASSGTHWRKVSDDMAAAVDGGRLKRLSTFSTQGRSAIIEMPAEISLTGDDTVGVEVTLRQETAPEYLQRFETTMWGAAVTHGVSTESHDAAMDALGVPKSTDPNTWCVGMAVWGTDNRLLNALPRGTLLEYGHDPERFSAYGVFSVSAAGGTTRVLGGATFPNGLLRVKAFPPGTTIGDGRWRGRVHDDEVRRVHDTKAMCYQEGMRVKRRHRWCETFEACLELADIPRSGPGDPPQVLTAEEVSALPVNTVVRVSNLGESVLLVRDDRMTNPARTRRAGGSVPGDWAAANNVVVRTPGQRMNIPTGTLAEMDGMPDGTILSGGGTAYTKRGLTWANGAYNYNSAQVRHPSYVYTHILGVN